MKLVRFFELAINTVDEFITSLAMSEDAPSKEKPRILLIESEEKMGRLVEIFSQEPHLIYQSNYTVHIAHYLRQFIPKTAHFFILPIAPLTLIYTQSCSPEQISEQLKRVRDELTLRQEQMLFGWRVESTPQGLHVCNMGTKNDWKVFLHCVEKPTSDQQKTIEFEKHKENEDSIVCRLTAKEYLNIHQHHGILIRYNQNYLDSLKRLLEEDTHESISELKNNLSRLAEKKSASDLCSITQGIVRRIKTTGSNGTTAFYEALEKMSSIYEATANFHQQVALPKTEETEPTLTDKTKTIVLSVDELGEAFSQASVQTLVDSITVSLSLLNTIQTLPPLGEPYNPDIEKLISESVLSFDAFFRILEDITLIAEAIDSNPRQLKLIVQWLKKSSMPLFVEIINSLYRIRYDSNIIRLSTALINLLEAVKKYSNEKQTRYINTILHELKDNLINSLLCSGQYAVVLHWLPYFEQIFSELQTEAQYDYHLQQAADQNFRALLAQHLCEYKAARYHLDKAWECMENGLQAFRKNTPSDVESFKTSIASVLESIALCYRALGTEQFESGLFVDSAATFLQCSEQRQNDYCAQIIQAIAKAQNKTVVRTRNDANANQVAINDIRINLNWCLIGNFLSIKRWLSANTPSNTTLSENQGSLILSSPDQLVIRRLSELLTTHGVMHTPSAKTITFDEFTKLNLASLKKAFLKSKKKRQQATKGPEIPSADPSLSLRPCADLKLDSIEALEFRRLKSMHYKSIHHYNRGYFQLLEKNLSLFYKRCRDISLKLSALDLLVSTHLIQSLSIWTRNSTDDSDHAQCVSAAKKYAEEGRQFAVEHYGAEEATSKSIIKKQENNTVLDNIDEKIKHYETILSDYLREIEIFKLRQIVEPHQVADEQRLFFHSIKTGTAKIVLTYNRVSELRREFLKRTLCSDKDTYATRRRLICQSTLFCFELAYELLTQNSLLNIEGNSNEIALTRIQEELKVLLEIQTSMGLKFSSNIESYILVVRTKIEKDLSLDSSLQLLDRAFKLVREKKHTAHSALILLGKIDLIISEEIDNPFLKIQPYLRALFDFIKKCSTDRALKNEHNNDYIAFEVCRFIQQYLSLSQESLLRFNPDSLTSAFKLQLSIVQYYERTLLNDTNLSRIRQLIKIMCDNINVLLKNGIKTIAAIDLESKVRQDLIFENEINEGEHLVIPMVILSQQHLSTAEGQLIYPSSPLITLVVSCNAMFQYCSSHGKQNKLFSSELSEGYLLIAGVAKKWLEQFLGERGLKMLRGDDEGKDWFEALTRLITCLKNAHFVGGSVISEEHIPLIRHILQFYPDNQYLSFTLFVALSENTPQTTACPEAVEACYKAAEAGHAHAEYWYARLLESGNYGAERNPDLAEVYLQRSSDKGYYKAQLHKARIEKIGLFARIHAKEAMSNSETPIKTRLELMDSYGITYIPSQSF